MKERITLFLFIFFLFLQSASAQEVSPFDQCRNYVTIIVKEKDRSEVDLSFYMAKVEALEKEKKKMEEKIRDLEIKKKDAEEAK